MKPAGRTLRCAIYTRKSTEEGLDQGYNSLHAQRDACAAYILSQAGEGWTLLPEVYDDGGYSGGTMDRPALKRLLADIDAGKIDVVVVYKVDRLTRALTDFSRIVDVLDRAGASFVSVTQAFNTTTSMGRLTLNVLLSFAQFEREVTGERIRDKIAASKKLGMWMGGNLALGYDPQGRTLVINPDEAELVRHIFRRYLEVGSVNVLAEELEAQGVRSKRWTTKAGTVRGGAVLARGALLHILRNRLYLGEIPHKDVSHPGQHPPILDAELFDAVQTQLNKTIRKARPEAKVRTPTNAPLTGVVYDAAGYRMSPVHARSRNRSYRYYVSAAVLTGAPEKAGPTARVPAAELEAVVFRGLLQLRLPDIDGERPDWSVIRDYLLSVTVKSDSVQLRLNAAALQDALNTAPASTKVLVANLDHAPDHPSLEVPMKLVRRRGQVHAVGPSGTSAHRSTEVDPALTAALIRAEAWKRQLLVGEAKNVEAIGAAEGIRAAYVAKVLRVAFLAPDLKDAILQGRQPAGLTLQAVMTSDLPLAWDEQRRLYSA